MHAHSYKKLLATVVVAAVVIPAQFYCSQPAEAPRSDEAAGKTSVPVVKEDRIEKGKYLVNSGGCNDCHTPKNMSPEGPVPDETKLLSGHPADSKLPPVTYDATKPGNWLLFSADLTAAVGPWGMSFAANLTPDSTTGIGAWTADNFKNTMRTGKHLGQAGGRPVLPPMPWQKVGKMTDEDLEAMFAYLRTIPAIKNQVPAPLPPNQVMKK